MLFSNGKTDSYRGIAFKYKRALCEWCGIDETLEVDHIDENRNNNMPDNLRILCHKCHLKRHGCRERKRVRGKYSPGTPRHKRKK
jgi:5-methylcytosine-specific restriction endonuclease McrA